MRRAPFIALLAAGAGSLAFDLSLRARLPDSADWAEAAGALRAEARAGDAVQLWPAWAERARLYVDAATLFTEEDLAHADYVGVQRLWLLSLPRAPLARDPEAALRARGAVPGEGRRFGALLLRPWDLRAPPLAADLTRSSFQHEVDYVARRCRMVPIGASYAARGEAGRTLHVRAGIVGERAFDADKPPVRVQVAADGAPLGVLEVPGTARDGAGWLRLDVPLPPGAAEREFIFAPRSADSARPFCLQAWTTR